MKNPCGAARSSACSVGIPCWSLYPFVVSLFSTFFSQMLSSHYLILSVLLTLFSTLQGVVNLVNHGWKVHSDI